MTENNQHSNTLRPGEKPLRVGLFGGTFNPVHMGHFRVSCDVKNRFGLDRILVVPSAIPPHKSSVEIASARDRLEMVKLCFKDLPGFEISDIELKRKGPSFTIDTINALLSEFPDSMDLFLIIGTDAFFEIHTWYAFKKLLESVKLIVMTRPGDNVESDKLKEKRAGFYLADKIADGYQWSSKKKCFFHKTNKTIFFCDVSQLNISSTKIRNCFKEKSRVSETLLNNEVADYILKKGLYQ